MNQVGNTLVAAGALIVGIGLVLWFAVDPWAGGPVIVPGVVVALIGGLFGGKP